MDDFSVFGDSFDDYLNHLDTVLARCEETNLVLNWEKCHFMVREGIVLGHKISSKRIEVDKAKIEAIERLPPPVSVRGVRCTENQVADHLSRLEDREHVNEAVAIKETFPDEQLFALQSAEVPWLKIFGGKFKSKWSGPFEVVRVTAQGAVELKIPNSDETFLLNGQRVKHYYGEATDRARTTIDLKEA
ncbi:uncharacterized protein LOC132620008 [Lycium barbarum]|uniref:uncharacterized protein LOC132620008 n=1 Tax=Lycium barbarum TaxID=112863 RepID=UPI00293F2588|nr:uncharacterized protein LOC132620008 [Lycium barbarum]